MSWSQVLSTAWVKLLVEVTGLVLHLATAVIGEPFNRLGQLTKRVEPVLHRLLHQIAYQGRIYSYSGGYPAHDFPVSEIWHKLHSDLLAVVTRRLQLMRTSTHSRPQTTVSMSCLTAASTQLWGVFLKSANFAGRCLMTNPWKDGSHL
jgi:hypothetical protein